MSANVASRPCACHASLLCSFCADSVQPLLRREAHARRSPRSPASSSGWPPRARSPPRPPPPTAPPTTTPARASRSSPARASSSSAASSATSTTWPRAASSRPRALPAPVPHAAAQHRVLDDRAAARLRRPHVSFTGSELVYQFYPGHGIQIQWLGTFGKLNGYWSGGKRYDARARRAAGRDQGARRRARRRPRVGVPVPVRRPAAAVGQLARPGHRPAGDGPLRRPA